MNQASSDDYDQILTQKRGSVGIITLNRPKALNALSLEMIRQISAVLRLWEKDDQVSNVLFLGSGDRAFCAGGDVKSFYNSGMDYRRGHVDLNIPSLYFGEEYSLNRQIFNYSKPTIAIMDGFVMGGGYGIGGHCQNRIVTQNTVFAMPEVGIGFFPDVASVFHLLQSPNNFGRYLALSGSQIGAGDMLKAGLADYYISSDDVDGLISALADQGRQAIVDFNRSAPHSHVFNDYADLIESTFSTLDVFEICTKLREAGSVWATEVLSVILSQAPLSVLVTAKHLEMMQGKSFEDVIAADYNLAQNFIAYPDLYEGIRAALIDRDNKPVWEPETLDVVKAADIERYFKAGARTLADI